MRHALAAALLALLAVALFTPTGEAQDDIDPLATELWFDVRYPDPGSMFIGSFANAAFCQKARNIFMVHRADHETIKVSATFDCRPLQVEAH